MLKIATNIQGKNPVGITAANTNPVTIGGVDSDNKIKGLVLNSDGSITAKLAAGTAIVGKFIPIDADGDEKFTSANPASVTLTDSLPAGDNLIGATMSHGDIPNFLADTPNSIGALLGANAVYTQDAIDRPHPVAGEVPQGWFRGWVFSDQGGTLYLEESNVATSGWTTTSTKVVSAGVSAIIPWSELTKKYARYRYVNGAVAQGVFILIQYYKGVDKTPVMCNDGDFVTIGTKNDTAVIDPTASSTVTAGLKGILKQLQGDGTAGKSAPVQLTGSRGAAITHRTAITAADKVPTITITAADQPATAGSLTAVAHGISVAPGNSYGSVGVSALVTVTPTVNKSIDITIPQATSAEYYDIFLSTATTAPLWVARITEEQRATGCAITAVATVGEGGSAGVVNVQVVGTGQASTSVDFAYNNAYTTTGITEISCVGKLKAYAHVKFSLTDLRTLPSLVIVPFFQNGNENIWYNGQAQTVLLQSGSPGQSFNQVFEFNVDSAENMIVLIDAITGQGASVSVEVELV